MWYTWLVIFMKDIKYFILLFIFTGSIILMNHNYSWYQDTIVKVDEVKINKTSTEYNNNLKETHYLETVYVHVLNGSEKGKKLSFSNEETFSGVYENRYKVNDEIFVKLTDDHEGIKDIINLRRDKYLVPLFTLFVCLLIGVGLKKGITTFISLLINVFFIYFSLYLRGKGFNIFYLILGSTFFMTSCSLFLAGGFNRKSWIAILSSLVSLFLTFGLSYLVIIIFNKYIPYWFMNYVEVLPDYEKVFLSLILLSGLGAIMDIAITITSTLNELIANDSKIANKALKESGKKVSSDVMGTMVNVLLFTCFSSVIPMLLLTTRNGAGLIGSINMYAKIELIRFLTSSLGIMIAIPVSLF